MSFFPDRYQELLKAGKWPGCERFERPMQAHEAEQLRLWDGTFNGAGLVTSLFARQAILLEASNKRLVQFDFQHIQSITAHAAYVSEAVRHALDTDSVDFCVNLNAEEMQAFAANDYQWLSNAIIGSEVRGQLEQRYYLAGMATAPWAFDPQRYSNPLSMSELVRQLGNPAETTLRNFIKNADNAREHYIHRLKRGRYCYLSFMKNKIVGMLK